jgi:hypothetical protein
VPAPALADLIRLMLIAAPRSPSRRNSPATSRLKYVMAMRAKTAMTNAMIGKYGYIGTEGLLAHERMRVIDVDEHARRHVAYSAHRERRFHAIVNEV